MTAWQYADDTKNVVKRINENGAQESCVATRDDVVEWVNSGNTILEADPLPPEPKVTKAELKAQLSDISDLIESLPDNGK